jgi:hypothetical protein
VRKISYVILPQRIALGMIHVLLPRLAIDAEQIVHQGHDAGRVSVVGIQLDRIDELATRVRKTAGVHHLPVGNLVVAGVPIRLQKPLKRPKEQLRPFAPATHLKIEDDTLAGRTVLPEIGLVIAAAFIVG